MVLLASEVWALAHGCKCEGPYKCHWCGAPCRDMWAHDDPPLVIGIKDGAIKKALYPSNPWCCVGCWLWRRKRVTVNFLAGRQKDGQTAENFSWYANPLGGWAVDKQDHITLYEILKKPPCRFFLAFLEGSGKKNLLQHFVVNDNAVVEAGTRLAFTVNGTVFWFTTYELEETLRGREDGREPGARELVRLLGPGPVEAREEEGAGTKSRKGTKGGRPQPMKGYKETVEKVLVMSGQSGY